MPIKRLKRTTLILFGKGIKEAAPLVATPTSAFTHGWRRYTAPPPQNAKQQYQHNQLKHSTAQTTQGQHLVRCCSVSLHQSTSYSGSLRSLPPLGAQISPRSDTRPAAPVHSGRLLCRASLGGVVVTGRTLQLIGQCKLSAPI